MAVRTFITFETSIPNDEELRDHLEMIPPGRTIAEALVTGLCPPDSPHPALVSLHSFYGWEFQCGSCWCLIQCPDTWLMSVEVRHSIVGRLFRRRHGKEQLQCFLEKLRRFLDDDPRFSDARWFTKEEYDNSRPSEIVE